MTKHDRPFEEEFAGHSLITGKSDTDTASETSTDSDGIDSESDEGSLTRNYDTE